MGLVLTPFVKNDDTKLSHAICFVLPALSVKVRGEMELKLQRESAPLAASAAATMLQAVECGNQLPRCQARLRSWPTSQSPSETFVLQLNALNLRAIFLMTNAKTNVLQFTHPHTLAYKGTHG